MNCEDRVTSSLGDLAIIAFAEFIGQNNVLKLYVDLAIAIMISPRSCRVDKGVCVVEYFSYLCRKPPCKFLISVKGIVKRKISWDGSKPCHDNSSLYKIAFLQSEQAISFSDFSDVIVAVRIAGSIVGSFLVDKTGRKFLMIYPTVILGLLELLLIFIKDSR